MKALLQKVKTASVRIENKKYSSIDSGLLIFLGVEKSDEKINADQLAEKILKFRIFEDENQKMNLSVKDISGNILIVSQFTLCADCRKGTRPSFDNSAPPDKAIQLYEYFINLMKNSGLKIQTGKFGADMQIEIINAGPVTFMLEK